MNLPNSGFYFKLKHKNIDNKRKLDPYICINLAHIKFIPALQCIHIKECFECFIDIFICM